VTTKHFVPSLVIKRLAIFKSGKVAYEQTFHQGVNIIAGENGSGKSTIMDFIFFALGGEMTSWKEYAALCDTVIAEIEVNDASITLRRNISTERQRPLHLFIGSFDKAMSHSDAGWETYPYSRTASRESFSQILFRALSLPEAQTAEGNNLTMHQLLRLLYVDQMTPVQRIFRFEAFDPPILKEAIGNLLCGVSEFELFERQIAVRELKRRVSELVAELRSLTSVSRGYDTPLNVAGIERETLTMETERVARYAELDELARSDFGSAEESKKHEAERRKASEELSKIRTKIQTLEREQQTLEFEIGDSDLFLQHLEKMLRELDSATATYEELGGLKFEYCPSCFTAIEILPGVPSDHLCHLCKSSLSEADRSSRTLAVKLDLQIQQRESRQLQEERFSDLESIKSQLKSLRRDHQTKSATYDALSRAPISSRDAKIGNINRRIGFLEQSLVNLQEKIELAQKHDALVSERNTLNASISKLDDEITSIVARQDRRKREAYTQISALTLDFLRRDTGTQDDFVDPKLLQFSFGDDAVFVDGKSNFAASSLVVLKNSFHLAMMIASLNDRKFTLPRFMMFDNIEDKGMRPDRSHNFQSLIVNASSVSSTKHQIIFATSLLSPELRGSPYLVGPEYSKQNKTLNIR
jgi:AAA domain